MSTLPKWYRSRNQKRDQEILGLLQTTSLTYQQIGDKFKITRERVRQIRKEFKLGGVEIPPRPRHMSVITIAPETIIKNTESPYDDICRTLNISREKAHGIRNRLKIKGLNIPRRKRSSKFNLIINTLKEDRGMKYGRCKRVAQKLGLHYQYIVGSKCKAQKMGLMPHENYRLGAHK